MSPKPLPTLMTPGPVPLPPEVLQVLGKPMEHHRTPEFIALWGRTLANLKKIYQTDQDVYIHTSTGSGAMESALVNCLSPGDEVVTIVSGKFGERWADMAATFGARVIRHNVAWGEAVKVEDVAQLLRAHPQTRAVLCQACETSTATLHPIRELAQLIAPTPALFMVDAITALGALPMPMREWKIDVLIAGSQKAFMLPTGLSFISLSSKAWAVAETAKCPRFYFDLRKERAANKNGESYYSSAVTHVRALDLVLDIFLKQGLDRVAARIAALQQSTLRGARALGLEPFSKAPSPSVSALVIPAGLDGARLRNDMETHSGVIVMGGQDQLKGKIIRIGHMGAISDDDEIKTLNAIADAINRQKPGQISEAQIADAHSVAWSALRQCPAVVLK